MNTPYKLVELQDLVALLDPTLPLFADTETVKLYGKIRTLQVYQSHLDCVLIVEWPDPLAIVGMLNDFEHVYHNAHYDLTVYQEQSGVPSLIPAHYEDTFLAARIAFPQYEKFSLDEVMGYVLGYDPYERQKLDKKVLQKSDWNKRVLTEQQLQYAATDVYYMPQVYDAVKHCFDDFNYKLDMLTLKYCLRFQWNGLPVDHDRLMAKYRENEQRIADIALPINANSYQQVRAYLNCTESDDLALAKMEISGNEKAANVRTVRKLRKQNSFLDKFKSDRIYGKFKPSARSGRLTSNDQNMQQLPRALKGIFGYTPDDGRVLIYADYAQLELRTICAITHCLAMEELFRAGADLHGYTAELIYGVDYSDEERRLAKGYNFTLLYGGGINMVISYIIQNMNMVLQESQVTKDRKRWRNLWKEIYAWQEKGINAWRKGRLGSTPLGRMYKAKMMTDQLNIENQGAGADVAKLALHYFMQEVLPAEVKLCNFIHDSFIIDCPDDPEIYQDVAKTLADCMQRAWFECSKAFKVKDLPMPVDVMVGYNWGDIEKDDYIWKYQLEGMTHAQDN